MRVLFVSGELIGSAIVHRLIKEGCEVKLYIDHPDRKDCFDGFVEKVDDWRKELEWVTKEGLVIFDDIIFQGAQNELRSQGYSVYGGDSKSDRLEADRQYFQDKLKEYKLPALLSYDFQHADDAIDFVTKNPDTWVIKQNSHVGMLNHVGQRQDAKDVLDMLKLYKDRNIAPIHVQKKAVGVEIAVGRQFNGIDWVGPIKVNFEHKPLCNGDIGPLTAEMGTLAWCESDENIPIFKQTLAQFKPYLQEINYRGDVDINCIANDEGIWPLEATMRFGTPSTELHAELYESAWHELLKSVADGKQYDVQYKAGFGIVVSVAVPPFPYGPQTFTDSNIITSTGSTVLFSDDLSEEEMSRIYFEEVSVDKTNTSRPRYFLSGKHGYALYVTGHGETVEEAQKNAYGVVDKIIIPKMFYRTDIGDKFLREDRDKLKHWGLI